VLQQSVHLDDIFDRHHLRCSRRGCRIRKAGMDHDLSLTSRVELDVLLRLRGLYKPDVR
jgi:hypothetical protein